MHQSEKNEVKNILEKRGQVMAMINVTRSLLSSDSETGSWLYMQHIEGAKSIKMRSMIHYDTQTRTDTVHEMHMQIRE